MIIERLKIQLIIEFNAVRLEPLLHSLEFLCEVPGRVLGTADFSSSRSWLL